MLKRNSSSLVRALAVITLSALLLSGCGLFARSSQEVGANATAAPRAVLPTFTPTPAGQAPTPTPTISFSGGSDTAQAGGAVVAAPTNTPEPSPTPRPRLIVAQEGINVRLGPGTTFATGGTAGAGQTFDIISKNASGDWWQVCCVNGEPVWIFGQLARVENAESVQVGENLAARPVVAPAPAAPAAPAPAAPAPAAPAPANTPAPAAPPPATNDPCANIGGDGCKFKLRNGPAFSPNAGELKLTLGFVHGGRGDEPQGSYFVVVLKNGQNVGVPDSVRSFDPSVTQMTGPHGKYNYEYKVSLDRLGGNVAGSYTMWVLDGNGERDSRDVNFTVPEGQGEVYAVFDQN